MRTELRKMFWALSLCLSGLVTLMTGLLANAQGVQPEVEKILVLQPNGISGGLLFGHSGQAGVIHISVEDGQTTLRFSLTGLTPNAVHGVWLLLDSGANPCGGAGQPACLAPFVSCNGPQCVTKDPARGTPVNVFGFSPAAADDAGFNAGMGLDPNGFLTDADGNAEFKIRLNYDIFQTNIAPLVLHPGDTEGLAEAFDAMGTTCSSSLFTPGVTPPYTARVDSAYMRQYSTSTVPNLPATGPRRCQWIPVDRALRPPDPRPRAGVSRGESGGEQLRRFRQPSDRKFGRRDGGRLGKTRGRIMGAYAVSHDIGYRNDSLTAR